VKRTRDLAYMAWAVTWTIFLALACCGIVSWIIEALS